MAFVGFSRQCEHKTAFHFPTCQNFCSVPIQGEAACNTASARVSKIIYKHRKKQPEEMEGLTSYHVSLQRVLCLRQGKDQKLQLLPLLSGQYSTDWIAASRPGWFCALFALQRAACQQLRSGKHKQKGVSARFAVQEAVTTSLLCNKIIGAEQRPEIARGEEQVSTVRLHASRECQAEPGDVILLSKSSQKLLTQIPCVTLPSTPQGTKSLLCYSPESPMVAGVVFSAYRRARGGWNRMEICSVISSLVFPPFVF